MNRTNQPRGCGASEVMRVVAAANGIFRAPPRGGDMGHDYPLLFQERNAGNLRIIEGGGEILAHAGFYVRPVIVAGRTIKVACFGAVFTREDHRHTGHATRVVEDAVAAARAQGADMGLVSGHGPLYQRLGFARISSTPRYQVSAERPTRSTGVSVAPYTATHLQNVMSLYSAEPMNFSRTPDDWTHLIEAGVIFYEPATIWIARSDAGKTAYAITQQHTTGPGKSAVLRALEAAGDRQVLARALPLIAAAEKSPALYMLALTHDPAFVALAAEQGWEKDQVQLPFGFAAWSEAARGFPPPWYGLNYV